MENRIRKKIECYDYQRIVDKLKHWNKVYKAKQAATGFKHGSEIHMKYLKMITDQKYRILEKIGVVHGYEET